MAHPDPGLSFTSDDPSPHNFNPCVTETFEDVPSTGEVVVPWRVFRTLPEVVHPRFRTESGEIVCDGGVNVLMGASCLRSSSQGYLDELTQSWVMEVSTEEELDKVTSRFSSLPTLLSAVLTVRSVLTDSSEIPVVVFISPQSNYIKQLVKKLAEVRQGMQGGKKFSVEVDIGTSLQQWGMKVLGREFLVVGGRFCVTSGAIFNHVFDWNNVFGCIPCLPCGIIGSAAYRIQRKMKYQDVIVDTEDEFVIIGAKDRSPKNQQYTTYLLMHWIKVYQQHYCMDCRHRLPEEGYHLVTGTFCQCEHRHATTSINDAIGSDLSSNTEKGGDIPRTRGYYSTLRGDAADVNSPESLNNSNRSLGAGPSDEEISTVPDGDESRGSDAGYGRAKVLRKNKSSSKSKEPSPFAPYFEKASGQAIQRKKNALKLSTVPVQDELSKTLSYLNTRGNPNKPSNVPKTIFRYPKKPKARSSRRSVTPQFVEVELKMADSAKEQSNKSVDEVTLPRLHVSSVLEDIDESEEDEEDHHAFYFHHNFKHSEDASLNQPDVHEFLNFGKGGKSRKAITKQPKAKGTNESEV